MNRFFMFAALLGGGSIGTVCAADPAGMPAPVPYQRLWQGDAPGAKGTASADIPGIAAYFPEKRSAASTAAVVIFPGGGYSQICDGHEGRDFALYLNQRGIPAFVVRYRLGRHGYRHPVMLQDAARAVRTVRAEAKKWNIDPTRIGVMGASAGGHLAATLMTGFDTGNPNAVDPIDRVSSRPDFGILCYPVITMTGFTHVGSRNNLLGTGATAAQMDELSAEKRVRPDTPPAFLVHTYPDGVSVRNSLEFARALRAKNVPFDLHIYATGGHGMGLGGRWPYKQTHPWTRDFDNWLRTMKLTK